MEIGISLEMERGVAFGFLMACGSGNNNMRIGVTYCMCLKRPIRTLD